MRIIIDVIREVVQVFMAACGAFFFRETTGLDKVSQGCSLSSHILSDNSLEAEGNGQL